MDHPIVHFEIPADEPEALAKFYTDLFGWRIERFPGATDYWMINTGGEGLWGGVMARQDPQQGPTNYVGVECIDTYLAKAEELGARVIVPKMAVGDFGFMAWIVDPQGNAIGMWEEAKK